MVCWRTGVLYKGQIWQRWACTPLNLRQTLVLNRVLTSMERMLTNAKRASMRKCASDTALPDINNLMAHGVLGRLSAYSASHRSYQIRSNLPYISRPGTQGFCHRDPQDISGFCVVRTSQWVLLYLTRAHGPRQFCKLCRHRGVAPRKLLDRQIVGLIVGESQIVR